MCSQRFVLLQRFHCHYESACGMKYTDVSTDGSGNFFQGATATGIESSDFGGTATFETFQLMLARQHQSILLHSDIFNTYPAEYLEFTH